MAECRGLAPLARRHALVSTKPRSARPVDIPNWSAWQGLHSQGCSGLSRTGLLFPLKPVAVNGGHEGNCTLKAARFWVWTLCSSGLTTCPRIDASGTAVTGGLFGNACHSITELRIEFASVSGLYASAV